MKVIFSDEGDLTHCEIVHQGKMGPVSARGSVNKAAIVGVVKQAIRKHGARKVAHALGCQKEDANYRKGVYAPGQTEQIPGIIYGIADAIHTESKCQALHKAATSMGWNPFKVIKKVAWDYNPAAYVARKSFGAGYGALKYGAKKAFGGKGGGGGGPETPEESTPDEDADEAQSDASAGYDPGKYPMGYELMQKWDIMGIGCDGDIDGDDFVQGSSSDEPMAGLAGSTDNLFDIGASMLEEPFTSGEDAFAGVEHGWRHRRRRMRPSPAPATSGDFEIGFAPLAAYQAYKHRQQLAKIAKSGNPRAANAAKSLAKAKGGDKREQAKIKQINKQAKAGDPRAKDAMKRLHAVDAMAKKGMLGTISALHRDGIT